MYSGEPKTRRNRRHIAAGFAPATIARFSCSESSSIHPQNEDQEDAWLQNPMVHKHSNFFIKEMN